MSKKKKAVGRIRPCRTCGGQGKACQDGLFYTVCPDCRGRKQVAA